MIGKKTRKKLMKMAVKEVMFKEIKKEVRKARFKKKIEKEGRKPCPSPFCSKTSGECEYSSPYDTRSHQMHVLHLGGHI